MTRKNRIIFEGAIYHVYQRGNNHEHVFQSSRHKEFLIKQIKEYNKVFDFQLLAYVIMDNHYHLLIRTNKTPISDIMFNINNVLGKYINRELGRTGHAFEGRYNSILVDSDAYLIWLLRYIHRNPLRACICSSLDEYRWSSHFFYKYGISNFVFADFILNMLSQDKQISIKQYLKLVNTDEEEKNKEMDYENIKHEFQLNDNALKLIRDEEIKSKIKSLDEILDSMDIEVETKELIKAGSKKRSVTPYKILFIREAINNKHTLKEIGIFLKASQPAISSLISHYRIS